MPAPRPRVPARACLRALACAACLALAGCGGDGGPGPVPKLGREGGEGEAAESLGFPAFATKNTTRVGGADEVADAAGVARAVYPVRGGSERPAAVAVVNRYHWQAGIAAAVLMSEPLRAPILLSGGSGVPAATREAIEALQPPGSSRARDAQVIRVGEAASPFGFRATPIEGRDPASLAAAVDRFQARASGRRSRRVVVVSQDAAAFAMPAAGWAAKAGDPVLFVRRNSVPAATRAALRRRRNAAVYVLGPPSVISARTVSALRRLAPVVRRISAPGPADPVESSIAFARYFDGSFGWNVNDPGHGLVVASASRPADAAAAAALSASGSFGPLLVTDQAGRLPAPLEQFLLDIKPGYRDDPSRAVYNHVWLIGDEQAIEIGAQAHIDELAEVAKIGAGRATVP